MALTKEEQLDAIERYYRSQVAGATSDEEELAIAQALLEAAERGHVVSDDGTKTLIVRSPEVPADAPFLVDEGALRRQELRRALPMAGVLLLALAAILLLYGGSGTPSDTIIPTETVPAQVALSTATLTPTVTPTPSATPTGAPTFIPMPTLIPTLLALEEVEVKIEPVKLDPNAVIPVSIEIAGRYFPVLPTGLRDDPSQSSGQVLWAYATEPDQVSWLAGSYVNVVLGLPYTDTNADLLAGTLALSDTVTLRNSVAAVNRYTVVERRSVSIYEIEAFSQRRAGLTLVLLGGSDEDPDRRLVVRATLAETDGEEVVATPEQ